jgi:hypothetical protein
MNKMKVPEFGIHSYLHPSTIAFIDLLHSTSQPLQFPTGRLGSEEWRGSAVGRGYEETGAKQKPGSKPPWRRQAV